MDPNATLKRIRGIVAVMNDPDTRPHVDIEQALTELCELNDALDQWLSKGGFLPSEWERKQ